MARRKAFPISPNPDINNLRRTGMLLIEDFKKEVHLASKEDVRWFWEDINIETDTEASWEYVNTHLSILNTQYIFYITEWFMEFYRYMPEVIEARLDRAGLIDFNIFFTLASPIVRPTCTSFQEMLTKLNTWQTRKAKEQIKRDCWENIDLRTKLLQGDLIPSIYLEYIPYQTLRKVILERQLKERTDLQDLFKKVLALKEQGKEIELIPSGKTETDGP